MKNIHPLLDKESQKQARRYEKEKRMFVWKGNGAVDHSALYNLAANPTEEGNDLASEQPAAAEALKTELLSYLTSVGADKPVPRQAKSRK